MTPREQELMKGCTLLLNEKFTFCGDSPIILCETCKARLHELQRRNKEVKEKIENMMLEDRRKGKGNMEIYLAILKALNLEDENQAHQGKEEVLLCNSLPSSVCPGGNNNKGGAQDVSKKAVSNRSR